MHIRQGECTTVSRSSVLQFLVVTFFFWQSLAAEFEWEAMDTPYIHQGGRYIVRGTKEDLKPLKDPPQTKLDALLDKRSCFDKLRQGFLGSNLSEAERIVKNIVKTRYSYR